MFCRNCGKEISDKAVICPDCGEPTYIKEDKRSSLPLPESEDRAVRKKDTVAIIALIFSIIGFLMSFMPMTLAYAKILVIDTFIPVLGSLPSIASLAVAIYTLRMERDDMKNKLLSVTTIIITSVTLLYTFLFVCIYPTAIMSGIAAN